MPGSLETPEVLPAASLRLPCLPSLAVSLLCDPGKPGSSSGSSRTSGPTSEHVDRGAGAGPHRREEFFPLQHTDPFSSSLTAPYAPLPADSPATWWASSESRGGRKHSHLPCPGAFALVVHAQPPGSFPGSQANIREGATSPLPHKTPEISSGGICVPVASSFSVIICQLQG